MCQLHGTSTKISAATRISSAPSIDTIGVSVLSPSLVAIAFFSGLSQPHLDFVVGGDTVLGENGIEFWHPSVCLCITDVIKDTSKCGCRNVLAVYCSQEERNIEDKEHHG